MERSLATAAGLGWTGKNTCLIHPKLGSFGFLAVLLTTSNLMQESKKHWKSCRTGAEAARAASKPARRDALIAPYQMDATKCIAYLTIEHKGRHCAGADGRHGAAGVRLRHLPGCLPVESQGADQLGSGAGSAGGAGESGAGVAGCDGRAELSSGPSMARRCGGRDSRACSATWPLPWATAGATDLRRGCASGPARQTKACARRPSGPEEAQIDKWVRRKKWKLETQATPGLSRPGKS